MVFSSIVFLLYFLPIFLLTYFFVGKKLKNLTILIFSIVFYAWGAPKFVFILIASTIIDYYLVNQLFKAKLLSIKKKLLAVSISLNLGLLLYFKYANFFVENANNFLSGFGITNLTWTEVALPIGISFYTFQTLTYSVDVYRGVRKPLSNVLDYLLYIMMFPQMIAGPIVRFNTIAEQITSRISTSEDKLVGFYRFIIGLAKKVLIANVMSAKADAIFSMELTQIDSSLAWIGIIAYTFQIYFDFSGYSDMAIGIGRMLGFTFPENFNNPYISKNITEFWRRWHMTLGTWMKDYLYIPLGGNRVKSKSRLFFNLWFVFLISGFWHGASWNFVLWGAFHGVFLILDRLFLIKLLNKIGSLGATIITFFTVVLGWVVFRIEEFADAKIFYKKLFSFDFNAIPYQETNSEFYTILVFAILFSFITISKVGLKLEKYFFYTGYKSFSKNILVFIICAVLLIYSISSITSSGFNPFIYFRF